MAVVVVTVTAEYCDCGRPPGSPDRPHWWPDRDPEPGPQVQIVVRYGDDLHFLRMLRLPGGWYRHGVAVHPHDAAVPWTECVAPWAEVGRCWAGYRHAVIDATGWPGADDADLLGPKIRALYARFLADLGGVLDTEAGLRAILTGRPRCRPAAVADDEDNV